MLVQILGQEVNFWTKFQSSLFWGIISTKSANSLYKQVKNIGLAMLRFISANTVAFSVVNLIIAIRKFAGNGLKKSLLRFISRVFP